jgi:hypothetical protein
MEKFGKIIGMIVAVLIILTFYWTRYQVIPVNYAYAPAFYKVNRLTGEINLVVGKEYVAVEKAEERGLRPAPSPSPAPAPAPSPSPAPSK